MIDSTSPVFPQSASLLRRRIAWLVAMIIPVTVVIASTALYPRLFDVTIANSTIFERPDRPVLLYSRGGAAVYFTSADLLHPESFGSPGEFIDGMTYDVIPTAERKGGTLLPTWHLQIARALKLEDADGRALPGLEPDDRDIKLRDRFATAFVPSLDLTLTRGSVRSLPIPEDSNYRTRTGLHIVTAMAVARPPRSDALRTDRLMLDVALAGAVKDLVEAGGHGLGFPCIPSLSNAQGSLCDVDDWSILLGASDTLVRSGAVERVLLGGWAKTDSTRDANFDAFRQAWTLRKGELQNAAGTAAHEPLRLAALTVAGAFLSSFIFGRPFSWTRLVAIVVLSFGLGAAVSPTLSLLRPLWDRMLSPVAIEAVKAILCFVVGFAINWIVRFDARRIIMTDIP